MSSFLISIPATIFLTLLLLFNLAHATPHSQSKEVNAQSESVLKESSSQVNLVSEIEEMKLKIAQLESALEERVGSLSRKVSYLEDKVKLAVKMEQKIESLHADLVDLKNDSNYVEERISALEEEVRLLWEALRKNNFDVHILESKTLDAESRLKAVTKRVTKVNTIVTEQWIQIRQLEQALQVIKRKILENQRKQGNTISEFLKFVKDLFIRGILKPIGVIFTGQDSSSSSWISQAQSQIKRITSSVKKYHFELQRYVKQEMDSNEFTATLAHPEVVFFLASAIITFPFLSAWMLLLSHFGCQEDTL